MPVKRRKKKPTVDEVTEVSATDQATTSAASGSDSDSTIAEDGGRDPSRTMVRSCCPKPKPKCPKPCMPLCPDPCDPCRPCSFQDKVCSFIRSKSFKYLLALLTGLVIAGFLYLFGPFIARSILPACWIKSTDQRIEEAIARYHADVIGLPDFALESSGGSVLCSSATFYSKTGPLYSLFGIPVWYASSSPREVIKPEVHPGRCWAMDGRAGFVTVQLRGAVMVTEVSLEHIPRAVAPSEEDQTAAPKEFLVVGKEYDMSSPDMILGRFAYRLSDKPIQGFKLKDPICFSDDASKCGPNKQVFRIVTLQVLSNHGNADFTCIYRFRVHGKTAKVMFQG